MIVAVVRVLQRLEGLSDREAVERLMGRSFVGGRWCAGVRARAPHRTAQLQLSSEPGESEE